MSKTKRVNINTISALLIVSLLFIDTLSTEKQLATASLTNDTVTTTNASSGLANTTNATGAISENLTSTLGNATSALENATAGLINATNALVEVAQQRPSNATTTVNGTGALQAIVESPLPYIFISLIFIIMLVPLIIDIILAYSRKLKGTSTDKENGRVEGMPGLYRSLMTFGVILLVGTVIFYILALITLNINSSSPVLVSLIDLLKNLGAILGTALATIIAFYFGVRGAESATEKAAAATTAAATRAAGEKAPPKVLNTIPADGGTGVPVTSLISATFSEPMSGPTINESTFTVRKDGEAGPIGGDISLNPDGKTAIFDPKPDLTPNTKYIAEIREGAKDLAGIALVSPKQWSFRTAS